MDALKLLEENLEQIIKSADLTTRAGRKAYKRAKIDAKREYIADVMRQSEKAAKDERHYALLTANKAKTFAPVAKAKKAKKEKKTNFATGRELTEWELYLATLREEEKRSDAALAWANACVVEVVKETEEKKPESKTERRERAEKLRQKNTKKAKENAEGVLYLRSSGIWARRETISAKESAKWMKLLLDIKDSTQPKPKPINLFEVACPKEAFASWKKGFDEWRKNLCTVKYFNTNDRLYEESRRKYENENAAFQLGYPAKRSALVFSNELIAVENIIGEEFDVVAELGCKMIFSKIEMYNSAISVLEDRVFEMRDSREETPIEQIRAEVNPLIERTKKEISELKVERKMLNKVIDMVYENATDLEKHLIDARRAVLNKRAKKEKQPEGRQIDPASKAPIKGFKMLAVPSEAILPRKMKGEIRKLVDAAIEYVRMDNERIEGRASDDECYKARKEVRNVFRGLVQMAKEWKESGEPMKIDTRNCHSNNARQSQLTDIIEVPYGTLTDMVASLEHNMANLIPDFVTYALDEHLEVAQRNIDELEVLLTHVITDNDVDMVYEDKTVRMKFWNANNADQKLGKVRLLSADAFERAKDAAQAGMLDEEFEQIKTSGADMLKWFSYAATPGCPLTYLDENGKERVITVNDVLVVDSIEVIRVFQNVMDFRTKDGGWCNGYIRKSAGVPRTAFDGQMFLMVNVPSQQMRGGMSFKGYGVRCVNDDGTTIVDEIAAREHRDIPEYIPDIDRKMRRWRDYKIICTKDCWKWASYGISYEEYCQRMNKLAEKYPGANAMYTARVADATEESKRHMSRQSNQQMLFAAMEQINELVSKSVGKLRSMNTPEGIVRKLAGLDKPEEERTPFERLVEIAPEILTHEYAQRYVEDVFNRSVAEAAISPEVDGIYPYIAEDPVAFFKIVIFGEDPNKLGLGYLKADQVNIPNACEGKEMYLVRYPNNYLCGMIAANHNDDIYRCVGNTMILSFDGYFLIRADGDVDGDEMCAVFNECVIEMMKTTIRIINPPLIVFPHQTVERKLIIGKQERAKAIARALVIANKFGPAVGINSNLATKFMHMASKARYEVGEALKRGDAVAAAEAKRKMTMQLNNAIIAHIAAIIAIDLAKTGEMPAWLQNKLDEIRKFAGKKMPWNQRFNKDNKSTPWFDSEYWDGKTRNEEKAVCDIIGRAVLTLTKAEEYKCAIKKEAFKMDSILGSTAGLVAQGSQGKLEHNALRALDARNFQKDTETGDEQRMLEKLRSDDPTDKVGFAELMAFFWRNQASLMYKLGRSGEDSIGNTVLMNEYYQTVRDIMIRFGSFCGNEQYSKLTPEKQMRSNVLHAIRVAFGKNSIGKNLMGIGEDGKPVMTEAAFSAKASFAMFGMKVFASDIGKIVREVKGITEKYEDVGLKVPMDKESVDLTADSAMEALQHNMPEFDVWMNGVGA